MAYHTETTFKALIKPIPAKVNLENVNSYLAGKTCEPCSRIVPDRRNLNKSGSAIKCDYERVDLYPDFPELKASATSGCALCKLIRKAIRKAWAVRPMDEAGVGTLREDDGLWDDLFSEPWDRKVRIYQPTFFVEKVAQISESRIDIVNENLMVAALNVEFGPENTRVSYESPRTHDRISQIISFKAFDSQGE